MLHVLLAVAKSFAGGYTSQKCLMSTFAYATASSKGFDWAANVGAGAGKHVGIDMRALGGPAASHRGMPLPSSTLCHAGSVDASGSSASGTSTNFTQVDASCVYVQSPGTVVVPLNATGGPAYSQWLNDIIAENSYAPVGM